VVNAREAVFDRGEIHVRCGERRGRARPTVFLEVADSGPGISESVRETIFEPFVTTKRHGTGLGLALCPAIVDVHRGTIRAANRDPGPGAVFTVESPPTSPASPGGLRAGPRRGPVRMFLESADPARDRDGGQVPVRPR
jgi:signal transduction histidine kinase